MKIAIRGVQYEIDENSLTNIEAMEIEKITGGTFTKFSESLEAGSILALTALVWTVQRRDDPQLRFSDVKFSFGELEVIEDTVDAEATADPSAPV